MSGKCQGLEIDVSLVRGLIGTVSPTVKVAKLGKDVDLGPELFAKIFLHSIVLTNKDSMRAYAAFFVQEPGNCTGAQQTKPNSA